MNAMMQADEDLARAFHGEPAVLAHCLEAPSSSLPLVIEPATAAARSSSSLAAWLSAKSALVEEKLALHGAILFRGFAIPEPVDFERVARAVAPDLKNKYLGTSPRDALTEYVFSASELPPYYPIPQHSEMTFIKTPPTRLFFCCFIAPAGPGGETPLADVRRVYRAMDPEVRARFEEKGVRIVRNYSGPEGGSRVDPFRLKRWDELFATSDRGAVEAMCRENGFDYEWRPGGELRLTSYQPGVVRHPVTGEPVWFNHSQVFHAGSAAAEYDRISRRLGRLRYRGLAAFARAAVAVKERLGGADAHGMHCTYGDGTPISEREMELVRDAIWENMVFVRWRAGDIVAIDNHAVSHGRMPYEGPRKVAVCWA